MSGSIPTEDDSRSDVLGSIGLLLNVGAVISAALWVGMAGGAYHGAPVALAGVVALLCLAASITCFALGEKPD